MLKDLKILIVEDDAFALEQMQELLSGEVKKVLTASNASDALDVLKSQKPDIVVTDVNLPDINGLEMSKIIKSLNKNIPIIVVSAYNDKEFLLKAINEVGVSSYLLKPLDYEKLISKLNAASEKIKTYKKIESADLDYLTGAYNRRRFESHIKNLIETKKDFTLFFIDLDDFKKINDMYGHVMGDEVLKVFVKKIKHAVREGDMLFRIGGDEFALVIEAIESKNIEKIAKKILNSINVFYINDKIIQISCSIGVKKYENEGLKEFLNLVDDALYSAKSRGKKRFIMK